MLATESSVLDVPYALVHSLLTLHEHSPENQQETEVNLSRLALTESNGAYLTLSSTVGRLKTKTKFEAFTNYQYHIKPNNELASVLEPGKKYTIRLAGKNLGVKWYAYGERTELPSSERKSSRPPTRTAQLVNSKNSAGKATFTVVSSLPRPPKVLMCMRLCSSDIRVTRY